MPWRMKRLLVINHKKELREIIIYSGGDVVLDTDRWHIEKEIDEYGRIGKNAYFS